MVGSNCGGRTFRRAVGIVLILVLAGGASAAGESFSTAISLSGSTSGSVSYQNYVYYKFSVTSGQQVTVKLTPSVTSIM